jgi:luciferase family oxidoreductase group 1
MRGRGVARDMARDPVLSVLDLSPIPSGAAASKALRNTVELARVAEAEGYRRFWLAEHHNIPSVTSSSPEVMIAAVGAATSTIRVGAGGIMLPNHAPLKVAETFRVLGGLYPDRIDLGIGRAPGTDPRTALALRRSREALTADDFPEQYSELVGYVDGFPAGHPFAGIVAQPEDVPLPPVWILGSSYYGAQAAAAFGTGFAYAGHFGGADPAEAVRLYRQGFRPRTASGSQEPHAILAAAAITSEDSERAEALAAANALSMARLRTGVPGPLPSPEEAAAHEWSAAERQVAASMRDKVSVGTPETVVADLRRRAEAADVDEVMITTNVHDPAERQQALRLLARVWTGTQGFVTPALAQV